MAKFEAVVIAGKHGNMSDALGPVMSDYPVINYEDESRSLRLQTFDYVSTSGELNCLQMKPNVSVGGTTGITCIELSPRFAAGIAGSKLVGLKVNTDLKGTSAGTLSSDVRCIECKFDGGTGRTVSGMNGIHFMSANAATVTNGVFPIKVDAAGGGGTGWGGLAWLPNDSQVAKTLSGASQGGNIDGWIAVKIDTATLYIGCYDAAAA